MKLLTIVFFAASMFNATGAMAFLVSDIQSYNQQLHTNEAVGFNFNLADYGYNHLTDTISSLTLTYDFREIVDTEESFDDDADMSAWEFVIFYSWIFDARSIFADIDTGPVSFSISRGKNYECQYYDYVDGDEICAENLDLTGRMGAWFVPYTDNLWLGDVRLDAQIDRIILPEPSPLWLSGLSLLLLVCSRFVKIRIIKP